MRREFSKQVRRDAFLRADGKCENPDCGARLSVGKFHYDHDIPDGLGGEPTLKNCVVLCMACHGEKTRKEDIPRVAKAKRVRDKHIGIRSRGFAKRPPQRTATRPIVRRGDAAQSS